MGGYQSLISLLSMGVAIGLLSSTPLGPINLTLMTTALRMEMRRCMAIAVAVALADGCYAFAAVSALSILPASFSLRISIELAGVLLVMGYGVYLALPSNKSASASDQCTVASHYQSLGVGFLAGIALYVSNPSFIVFWLSIAGAIQSWISFTAPLINRLFFGIGVVVGTALWFGILLYAIRNTAATLSPSVLRRLSLVTSCLLIGFGSYVLIKRLSHIL